MIIVCVQFKDTSKNSRFVCHEDIRVSNIKHHLIDEMNLSKSVELIFRDKNHQIIEEDVPIDILERIVPWAEVIQLHAEYKKDRNERRQQDIHQTAKKVWTVEPTVDDASFGRWIVRPDLTFSKRLKYSVLVGVFQGDSREFNWHIVEVTSNERMEKIREVLSKQYELPIEDLRYSYESGFFYKGNDGRQRHATNFANVVENRVEEMYRDDEDNTLLEMDKKSTVTYRIIHDSSRFSIPSQGAPKIWIFTKTEFYTSAPDTEFGIKRLYNQDAIEDENIVAFNDGLLLKDKTDESKRPKFFVSLNSGDMFADIETGTLYESRQKAYDSDDYDIPKEDRLWGLQVFLMYDGMKLPHWRIPPDTCLQLLVQEGGCVELRDGALCRTGSTQSSFLGNAKLDRWCDFYTKDPTEEHLYKKVTDYFRSVEGQRL